MHSTYSAAIVALLVIVSASAPASAALLGDDENVPEIVTYGIDGQPSFIVEYEDDKLSSLQTWADEHADREVVRTDNDSNVAVVSAPSWHVTGSFTERVFESPRAVLEDPLDDRSYVTAIHPNYELSYAEPVGTLTNVSEFETPTIGRFALDDPDFSVPGMAFDGDADRTTMADSRSYLGVDDVSATGSGQTIALIDTGANVPGDGTLFGNGTVGSNVRIHNDSKNVITDETINATAGDYDAIGDGNGHGTWVASAAAGDPNGTVHDGIAPGAELLILKALDDGGSGETENIRRAVDYAVDNGADVISMSLGSPVHSQPLADAIDNATNEGVVVVLAVGNSRQTVRWVASPADANESVIAVTATNGSAPESAGVAYFAQQGPDPGTTDLSGGATQGAAVTVGAPGMETVARVATENDFLENSTLSGTSMATPMVAGGVALVLEANPSWAPADVVEWTERGAAPIPGASTSEVGHGMFNADNTIDQREPDQDQDAAMTDAARARDEFYRRMSDSSGGFTRFIPGVGA